MIHVTYQNCLVGNPNRVQPDPPFQLQTTLTKQLSFIKLHTAVAELVFQIIIKCRYSYQHPCSFRKLDYKFLFKIIYIYTPDDYRSTTKLAKISSFVLENWNTLLYNCIVYSTQSVYYPDYMLYFPNAHLLGLYWRALPRYSTYFFTSPKAIFVWLPQSIVVTSTECFEKNSKTT